MIDDDHGGRVSKTECKAEADIARQFAPETQIVAITIPTEQ